MGKRRKKTKREMPASKKVLVGKVQIDHETLGCGSVKLNVMVEDGGDSDTAIDTMLLAILQTCSSASVDPTDVVTRTAFRMAEIAKMMKKDPGAVNFDKLTDFGRHIIES